MTTSEARRRFPWGLTLAVIPALALLIGLGVWQVQRLHWKEGLIAEAEAAAKMPPVAISDPEALTDFRKVELTCAGLATAPYVELQTIHGGQAGSRLISGCYSPELKAHLLIDRGFVVETISARPPVSQSDTPVRIVAEYRMTPEPGRLSRAVAPPVVGKRLFIRDDVAIAIELGLHHTKAGTLFALTSTNPEWQALKPSAPPVAFENNHLGYAATWFGLALALLGFYAALVMRRMKA